MGSILHNLFGFLTATSTERFKDLDNQNLATVISLMAQANLPYCPSYLKNPAGFKSGQKRLENNIFASLA